MGEHFVDGTAHEIQAVIYRFIPRKNKKPLTDQGFKTVVAGPGIEPGTQGFSVLCSTN